MRNIQSIGTAILYIKKSFGFPIFFRKVETLFSLVSVYLHEVVWAYSKTISCDCNSSLVGCYLRSVIQNVGGTFIVERLLTVQSLVSCVLVSVIKNVGGTFVIDIASSTYSLTNAILKVVLYNINGTFVAGNTSNTYSLTSVKLV